MTADSQHPAESHKKMVAKPGAGCGPVRQLLIPTAGAVVLVVLLAGAICALVFPHAWRASLICGSLVGASGLALGAWMLHKIDGNPRSVPGGFLAATGLTMVAVVVIGLAVVLGDKWMASGGPAEPAPPGIASMSASSERVAVTLLTALAVGLTCLAMDTRMVRKVLAGLPAEAARPAPPEQDKPEEEEQQKESRYDNRG